MIELQFDRVSRDFDLPRGGTYRVFEDISLDVYAGAFVALVGPSGCGKSTLLNVAAGLLPPTAGQVVSGGSALTGLNRRATYLFQEDALLPWKNVRDNVALGLTLAGVARAEACARADAWLARVGLTTFAAHYPAQLSGGMRKRVAMAQHWIIDRGLLLMDEPFSALDVHTRQRMETELLLLWEGSDRSAESLALPVGEGDRHDTLRRAESLARHEGGRNGHDVGRAFQASRARKTVLFVTHDLEEAIALADEVLVLSAGPASRIVGRHRVTLERPRDVMELRTTPAFIELYRTLWGVLRSEVLKSQRNSEARRG
jgi:NitT/TauT family transport system ATP-binding protein